MSACEVSERRLYGGYARVWHDGRHHLLHRFVYEAQHGPVPPDWDVHHECGNRACVNLEHLTALPHAEHARLHKPPVTHCPHGHAMTPDNVYHYGEFRHCKTCRKDIQRRYRARRRGVQAAREQGDA